MTDEKPVHDARELRELIESEAEAIEATGSLSEPVVAALDERGLFKLLVPRDLGGREAGVAEILAVCEALSHADGSTGWAFAQNITVHGYAAYLAPDPARQLAGSRASAGMFAPLGTALRDAGHYRISGDYAFGSGSGHAEFMGGAAMVYDGSELVMKDSGLPEMIGFVVPAEQVEFRGNWDVMGLRGTGSYDFSVPEQSVEAGATFDLFSPEVVTGGDLYHLGPIALGTIGSVGWCIGVARRALDEIAGIAMAGRARLGSDPLREQQVFQQSFGGHCTAIDAANRLVCDTYERAIAAMAGDLPTGEREARMRATRAAATHASLVSKQAVQFAWEAAGSAGIRNPSRLQRCFRDICVGATHQVFDQRNFAELAKPQLGLAPALF